MDAVNVKENCLICRNNLSSQEIVNVKSDIESLRDAAKEKKDGNLAILQNTDSIDVHKVCLNKYIGRASKVQDDDSSDEEEDYVRLTSDDDDEDEDDRESGTKTDSTDLFALINSTVKSMCPPGMDLTKPIPRRKVPANFYDKDDEDDPFDGKDFLEYLSSVYTSMMPPGRDLTKPIPRLQKK